MALVDFYQLAALYKLARGDAGVLSNHSYPPPMPASTLPNLASRWSEQFISHPLLATSPRRQSACAMPLIPSRSHSEFRWIVLMQKLEPDTESPRKANSAKYEEYIIKDFERHRVFVDIDVFMKHVLHVPDNWKNYGGRLSKKSRQRGLLDAPHRDYTDLCGTRQGGEVLQAVGEHGERNFRCRPLVVERICQSRKRLYVTSGMTPKGFTAG
jgi:hypothetical protein